MSNPLLQELLLSGTYYQTPSPHWLRYHPSEAICLLHYARRRAHSIAKISVRRLAIIIHIQIQNKATCPKAKVKVKAKRVRFKAKDMATAETTNKAMAKAKAGVTSSKSLTTMNQWYSF